MQSGGCDRPPATKYDAIVLPAYCSVSPLVSVTACTWRGVGVLPHS